MLFPTAQIIYTVPGTIKSPNLANRRLAILEQGSVSSLSAMSVCRCWLHVGSSTLAQSAALIKGKATRHSCKITRTSLGDGLIKIQMNGHQWEVGTQINKHSYEIN